MSSIPVGSLVVCLEAKGFRSGCFGARVIKSPFADRGARDGYVWVRETGLGVVGEAWVTEWPLEKIAIEALAIEPLA